MKWLFWIFVALVLGGVILFAVAIVLLEKGQLWLLPVGLAVIIAGAIVWAIFLGIQDDKRRAEINTHREEWGDEICNYLVTSRRKLNPAVTSILAHIGDWGQEICLSLLRKSIGLGMTAEMIRAALGAPTSIDNQEISGRGQKYRWIYGVPRHGAAYIWFTDDKVTRIKQS